MSDTEKLSLRKNLERASSLISTLNVVYLQQRKNSEIQKLELVQSYIENATAKTKDYPRTNNRKALNGIMSIVYNEAASIVDLLDNGDASKKDVVNFLENANSNLHTAMDIAKVVKNEKLKKDNPNLEGAGIFDSYDPKNYSDAIPTDAVLKKLLESEPVIKNFQRYSMLMPHLESEVKSIFSIKRMPVIAIFQNPITTKDLEQSGFQVSNIGFYPIIENQIIIGIADKKMAEKKIDSKKFFDTLLAKIERETHSKYQVIGKPTGFRNSGVMYYWIAPESNINRMRVKLSKSFLVKQWQFPFR